MSIKYYLVNKDIFHEKITDNPNFIEYLDNNFCTYMKKIKKGTLC